MKIIINFEKNKKYKFDFDEEKLSKKIAKTLFELEKVNFDVSFNVSIVDSKKIKKINKEQRDIDKVTDVLSFPNLDFDKPSKFSNIINKNYVDVSYIDLNTKTIFLGDVVICYDMVKKQADIYGHSVKREYSFLLIHSLLHLLGYDHMTKKDEKKMFTKQDLILDKLKIYR